jgi:putative ABC transport system permease protein
MKKYQKYIVKDMGKLLPKLLAIVLIVILGVGFSVGLLTAAPNMHFSVEKYFNNVNAADIIVQGSPFTEDVLDGFKENELIEDTFGFYSFDSDVEFKNGTHLAKINVVDFNNDINVNKLTLVEGRFPTTSDDVIEIVIERKQPFLIDVPLGYETHFMDKVVRVVGIVHNPWYFAFVEEISQQEQRPIEIIIYADNELLDKVEYTHIAATLKDARNYATFADNYETFVNDKVDLLKHEYSDYYFTTRNLNQSFAKYKSDVKIVEAIALIFPLFFLLITILVSMASVTRIVEDQRGQIGTLRSLGYGKFRIMGKYILYALISSGLGAIIGIGLGVYFIPAIIYNAYETIYNLPPFNIKYYWGITSIISFSMIISVALVTISSVSQVLNEKPTELLKVKTPKPGKKIFFERIGFIWKKLKFKYKSTLRNIFRHKKNLILTLLGISGSTALLLAGFGIKDSVDLAGKYQFEEMMHYDLEININPYTEELSEISDYESIYIMASNAQYLSNAYISIIVPEDINRINDFIAFRTKKDQEFNMSANSVIVTKQFAMKNDLEVGDNLSLKVNDVDIDLKVTNIQEYYLGNNIYISKDLLEDVVEIKYNKVYVKTGTAVNQELRNKLEKNENILKVMFDEDLKYSFNNTSDSMNSIIIVLVVASSALAIIINYNLTLINVHTRKREIATLKVLGYQEIEVSGYVFRETLIVSTVAILLGLLVGKGLHSFIISRVVIDGIVLYNTIWWPSYLYTVVASFLFLGIVYFISLPQTRKINMIDALKSYE